MKRFLDTSVVVMRGIVVAAIVALSLCTLAITFFHLFYPFELEWNEGGILCHALMIREGHRLYVAPNADFFPFTYTPLYYYVLAAVSNVMGLHFWVGRLVSILSILLISFLLYRIVVREDRSRQGGLVAAGIFLAAYGFTGFWYDLCRMDSFAFALLLGGFYLSRFRKGWGQVLASLLFVLAVFSKQNMAVFLPFGGIAAFLIDRRGGIIFCVSTLIFLISFFLGFNFYTEGWFANYTLAAPLSHGIDWQSAMKTTLPFMLRQIPLIAAVACALLVVLVYYMLRRKPARATAFWIVSFAGAYLSYVVVIGHPGAYKNVIMPVILFGSILVGLFWAKSLRWSGWPGRAGRIVFYVLIAVQLWFFRYNPRSVIPTEEEYQAGENLLQRLNRIKGDVLMYYHPFYPVMVGKSASFHADAIFDRYMRGGRAELQQALPPELLKRVEEKRYAAIILDHRAPLIDIKELGNAIERNYVFAERLFPEGTSVFCPKTGWNVRPDFLYLPRNGGVKKLRRQWPVSSGESKDFIRLLDYFARNEIQWLQAPREQTSPVVISGGELRMAIMTGSEREDDEEYRIIYNFPGYGFRIMDVNIPERSRLKLGVGYWKDIAEEVRQGATFRVYIAVKGQKEKELIKEYFDPRQVPELQNIRWLDVDLEAWGGERVDLVFRVDSAGRARRQIDWPIWVDPCIVYPGGEEKVGPAQRARPNAIIIVSDALRLDHLPCYGYKRDTAPSICKLAEQGSVCFNVFAQAPWTKPAIGSIFTGLYPYEHGALLAVDVPQYREFPQLAFLSDDLQTLAEVFKESGYNTAGFSANVHLLRKLGFSQGFDYWQETEGLSSIEMMKDVLRWIERNRGSPFFIYIHLMDTHSPYYSFPPFRGMFKGCPPGLIDRPLTEKDRSFLEEAKIDDASMHSLSDVINRYDDCIYQTDSQIGELMRCLRNDGVLDNTFIAITADHGEALSEHGNYFHGWTLYNEVLRVPLVLFYPKLIPPGSKLEPILESRDIFSTFADLLNLAVRDPRKTKERSWRRLFKAGGGKKPGTAYSETEVVVLKKPEQIRSALSCIQDGRWKLIHDARTGEYELYNLESDPGETENVYARYPEIANSYREVLDKHGEIRLRKMEEGQLPVEEFSGVVRQRLKALGYLQ